MVVTPPELLSLGSATRLWVEQGVMVRIARWWDQQRADSAARFVFPFRFVLGAFEVKE